MRDDPHSLLHDEDPEDEVSDTASEDTAIVDDDTELADEDEADTDSETDAASDELTGEETGDTTTAVAVPTPASAEPTGISGPAALKPAEIESAVKSLAKQTGMRLAPTHKMRAGRMRARETNGPSNSAQVAVYWIRAPQA